MPIANGEQPQGIERLRKRRSSTRKRGELAAPNPYPIEASGTLGRRCNLQVKRRVNSGRTP
jgi:hypothetical protein